MLGAGLAAVGLSLVTAVGAAVLARVGTWEDAAVSPGNPGETPPRFAGALAFLSGFLVLGSEVVTQHQLAQVTINSHFSSAAILAGILLALAAASALAGRLRIPPARAIPPALLCAALFWILQPAALFAVRPGLQILPYELAPIPYFLRLGALAAISILPAFAAASPLAYGLSDAATNVNFLHSQGTTGQGVVVAVIDTGIRPEFPHLQLDGSVIGGEDLVGDGMGYSNNENHGHGTAVAGMISANAVFTFGPYSVVRAAVEAECPSCFVDHPTNCAIAMLGSAPLSSIYALRAFGPSGSAPLSRVVAAMERVIDLRQAFDSGLPGGVNIQVCNMSFGGPALCSGSDLADTVADALCEELQARVQLAGVRIMEAKLTHLAYAPEIAGAMLRRQQAEAVIAARSKLVLGAVSMVEMALQQLSEKNVVHLDDERKAAMVSNLMVVLCGERDTQPVVNTGTLYQ